MVGDLHRVVVIGTGPSACAVVSALLSRGQRPLIIDSAEKVGALEVTETEVPDLGTGFKSWNGSIAMYQSHPHSRLTYASGLTARASNHLGGFSRVWGATYGKYREYRNWPKECIPTQADWNAVDELMPHAVVGQKLPSPETSHVTLPIEPQLRSLFRGGAHASPPIAVPASLAIETDATSPRACVLEGSCLQGCSRDSIWWAGEQFIHWESEGLVDIRRGWLVESLCESRQHINLNVVRHNGSRMQVRAKHVFLGAGALATAAILVKSRIATALTVKDSQTAFGGMVSIRRGSLPQHTGPSLSNVWMRHGQGAAFVAQLYPPDQSHAARLQRRLRGLPPPLVRKLNKRLFPFIAYLDSDESGTLNVTCSGDKVEITVGSSGNRMAMLRNVSNLARKVLSSGFVAPPFALEMAHPGGGFHVGASMPHGQASDTWGRPQGLRRIHLVDASVFPHVEAGSITPTVMANAYRIGRTAPLEFT